MSRERTSTKDPNPKAMIEGLRSIGYDFSTAVADIIDNSITAGASSVDVFYRAAVEEPYFIIADNGCGMSEKELEEAMNFGSDKSRDFEDKNALGRFGLGLKTASLSQCARFTVVTKKLGVVSASYWDVDVITKSGRWTLINLTDQEIANLPETKYLDDKESGTMVIWQNFDKLKRAAASRFANAFNQQAVDASDYCALVFHRFYNKVAISFNNVRVPKRDPFLDDFQNVVKSEEQKIPFNYQTVKIRTYRMPASSDLTKEEKELLGGERSLVDEQGLYIYRNNRLIVYGKWLRIEHKSLYSRLARIKIDIPATLDKEWSLDVKKSTAVIPDDIKKRLKANINDGLNQSKRRIQYEGEKEVSREYERIWTRTKREDNSVVYDLNPDYPLYERLSDALDPAQRKLLRAYLNDVKNFIPASKLRDDVTENLKVINGDHTDEEKADRRARLIEQLSLMGYEEAVEYLDQILIFEPFAHLREEKGNLLKEAFEK